MRERQTTEDGDAARAASWAAAEFGDADLLDPRRTRRAVAIATALAARPTATLPAALPTEAEREGAYRFFANECVAVEPLLAAHVRATWARLASEPLVLAVQDTTLLDFSHHPATADLGPLATVAQQGLRVHSTLAFTPERVPLGLLAQDVWTRDPDTYGKLADPKTRTITEKESQKWLTSLAAAGSAKRRCPATQIVSVGDREADVYDLFMAARPAGVELLVRAAWDRGVTEPERRLRASVQAAAAGATVQVRVPPRGTQPARLATVALRSRAVHLRPPQHRRGERLAPVALWAVLAQEVGAPPDAEPLDWLLLTTVAVTSAPDAIERLEWYACRWGIEVWHKVLKSGCRLEATQLASAAALKRYLPIASVVAWRLLWATMLARVAPDASCTLLLEREEWEALCCASTHQPTPPTEPPPLRQAVRLIAKLGGFRGRPTDGEPGVIVLWRGFHRLTDLTTMYRIMRPSLPDLCDDT